MTAAKHTPGPWVVPDQTYRTDMTVEVDDDIACPGSGEAMSYTREVCKLGWKGTPEWDANARLIAAAPTMHSLLLEARHALANAAQGQVMDGEPAEMEIIRRIDAVLEAIGK